MRGVAFAVMCCSVAKSYNNLPLSLSRSLALSYLGTDEYAAENAEFAEREGIRVITVHMGTNKEPFQEIEEVCEDGHCC